MSTCRQVRVLTFLVLFDIVIMLSSESEYENQGGDNGQCIVRNSYLGMLKKERKKRYEKWSWREIV